MAEPLKKNEFSSEVEKPQPFRNQELREGEEGLNAVPENAEVRVETLSSNVVQWRPAGSSAAADELAAEGLEIPESSVAEEYLEFRDAISDMVDQGRRSVGEMVDRARYRFGYWSEEYPLQLFGAIAATGFVAGVLLRIWRSNRHE